MKAIESGIKTQVLRRKGVKKGIPPRYQASVVIVEGEAAGMEYPITKAYCVIGRSRDAAVHLNDPSVSRRHAAIIYQDDAFYLKDLGSTNGTYVGGVPINERRLAHGERFQLGDTCLQFVLLEGGKGRTYEIR